MAEDATDLTRTPTPGLGRNSGSDDRTDSGACTVPPEGWSCSRGAGHGGPCAASPTKENAMTKTECIDRAAEAIGKAEKKDSIDERDSWLRVADHWIRLAVECS